ncbi:hypothetical protein DVH24_000205 [Malus domestica]|uniref:Beta-glucosidase n=1 Tax=Malus domestica TaxID=3750 RepID=A0A498IZY7_MALDO|nr:hypothetical protein DVH24_000205 [Malus domestica]
MKKNYQSPKIYITENGINDAKNDTRRLDETLKDLHRVKNTLWHLYWLNKAIKIGVNVKGYFYWALLDNFEWGMAIPQDLGFITLITKTISSASLKILLSGSLNSSRVKFKDTMLKLRHKLYTADQPQVLKGKFPTDVMCIKKE